MKKFGLILATTALIGLAAPALAIEAGSSVKARTPVAQADVNAGVKSSSGVRVHHSRSTHKMAYHDRGLHRGFTHSRHLGYAKNHAHGAKVHVAAKSRHQGSRTSVTTGSGVSSQ